MTQPATPDQPRHRLDMDPYAVCGVMRSDYPYAKEVAPESRQVRCTAPSASLSDRLSPLRVDIDGSAKCGLICRSRGTADKPGFSLPSAASPLRQPLTFMAAENDQSLQGLY